MARADLSIVPERLNPEFTPELEQEVRFFQKWGYLVVDDAITHGASPGPARRH